MLDTTEEVKQFVLLQQKNVQELQTICKNLSLDSNGNKEDLLDRIMEQKAQPTQEVDRPFLLPLRTRGSSSDLAHQMILDWRKQIFHSKKPSKSFRIFNKKGEAYFEKMRYIKCDNSTCSKILFNEWILPLEQFQTVLKELKTDPSRFNKYIVQKRNKDKSFIMLYVELA